MGTGMGSIGGRGSRVTLIVIRSLGRVKTYDLSANWFRLMVAALALLVLATAGLAWQNHSLRLDRQRLVSQLFLAAPPVEPGSQAVAAGSLEPQQAEPVPAGTVKPAPEPDTDQAADAPFEPAEESGEFQSRAAGDRATGTEQTPAPADDTAASMTSASAGPVPVAATDPAAPATGQERSEAAGETVRPKESLPAAAEAPERSGDSGQGTDPAGAEKAVAAAVPTSGSGETTDAQARLARAVTENLADDRIEPENLDLDTIRTMRLAQPKGIKISYKIHNKLGGGKRISGYAFMIGLSADGKPVKAFPSEAAIESGRPVNHRQGRYFSIRQYTTIRGRIYTSIDLARVEVLIYDLAGRLVKRRLIEVGDV